ncbi:MAG: hypothetical protein EZS28_026771, partial [Streblomastix strix]
QRRGKVHYPSEDDISNDLRLLQKFVKKQQDLRAKKGSIDLNNAENNYELDEESFEPQKIVFSAFDDEKELISHKLIEELMITANVIVASFICTAFPTLACIRRHERVEAKVLDDMAKITRVYELPSEMRENELKMKEMEKQMNNEQTQDIAQLLMQKMKLQLDMIGQQTGKQSSQQYATQSEITSALHVTQQNSCQEVVTAISDLFIHNIKSAEYIVSGLVHPFDWLHFGLNLQVYTHFTSPIRRYPDQIVHRQLLAAIEMKKKGIQTFIEEEYDNEEVEDIEELDNIESLQLKNKNKNKKKQRNNKQSKSRSPPSHRSSSSSIYPHSDINHILPFPQSILPQWMTSKKNLNAIIQHCNDKHSSDLKMERQINLMLLSRFIENGCGLIEKETVFMKEGQLQKEDIETKEDKQINLIEQKKQSQIIQQIKYIPRVLYCVGVITYITNSMFRVTIPGIDISQQSYSQKPELHFPSIRLNILQFLEEEVASDDWENNQCINERMKKIIKEEERRVKMQQVKITEEQWQKMREGKDDDEQEYEEENIDEEEEGNKEVKQNNILIEDMDKSNKLDIEHDIKSIEHNLQSVKDNAETEQDIIVDDDDDDDEENENNLGNLVHISDDDVEDQNDEEDLENFKIEEEEEENDENIEMGIEYQQDKDEDKPIE